MSDYDTSVTQKGPGATGDKSDIPWLGKAFLVVVPGLIGTAFGAFLQGYMNYQLERHKFEFGLVQKALETPSHKDAAVKLEFLSSIGLLGSLDREAVVKAASDEGKRLPIFLGSAIRDRLITLKQAKEMLEHLGFYKGPFDDDLTVRFKLALMKFQRSRGLDTDGLLGGKTVFALWEACPACFDRIPDTIERASGKAP